MSTLNVTLDAQILDAVADVTLAGERVLDCQKKLNDLRLEKIFAEFGVKIGSRARGTGRKVIGTVCKIDHLNGSRPWLVIHPDKKDGSPGLQEIHLYSDWELIL